MTSGITAITLLCILAGGLIIGTIYVLLFDMGDGSSGSSSATTSHKKYNIAEKKKCYHERRIALEGLVVSEPVISFVKVFFNNPKRFILKELEEYERSYYKVSMEYSLVDKQTKEEYKIHLLKYPAIMGIEKKVITWCSDNISFLTDDENEYLVRTVVKFYEGRSDILRKYRIARRERVKLKTLQQQRDRLSKIYCEGES